MGGKGVAVVRKMRSPSIRQKTKGPPLMGEDKPSVIKKECKQPIVKVEGVKNADENMKRREINSRVINRY